MQRFLLILVATTNVLISCGQSNSSKKQVKEEVKQEKPKGDRGKMNLKGDVESIIETTSHTDQFDNVLREEITYHFNSAGNKIEYTSFTNQDFIEKSTYDYDGAGNIIKENIFKSPTAIFRKNIYTFDNRGNKTGWTWYNPDGSINSQTSYNYDEKGHLIEESTSGMKYNYKYDNDGNQIESNWYNTLTNRLIETRTMKYDGNKNKIEVNIHTSAIPSLGQEEKNEKSTFKYDNNGNLIEDAYYRNESFASKRIYKYDSNGNQISEDSYDSKGQPIYKYAYKYEYDTKKNWTKKTKFENNQQSSVYFRKVNYGSASPTVTTANIYSLRKLNNADLKSDFFDNAIVRQRLLKLLGKERFAFMEGYWSIGTPVKIENDILVTTGCMSHFCPSTNFIVIIDISQNTFHAGIRDDDKVKTYTENENSKTPYIKQKLQHWIEYGSD